MELLAVTPELEKRFLEVVEGDYFDYYFFIYDWLLQRSKTKVFLAQDNGAVAGLMVVYDEHIAQLRGGRVAVEFMLENLALNPADVQVPADCEDLLEAKYPKSEFKAHVTLMYMRRGEEQPRISQEPERLTVRDASGVAQIMHEADLRLWRDVSAEAVASLFSSKEALWLGIRHGGKLVSFGYAMLTPKVCHVTWIATRPGYERMGYASSIVSALVRECLKVAEGAVIYVMDDNDTAKGIYFKAGFKPYKSYMFVKT